MSFECVPCMYLPLCLSVCIFVSIMCICVGGSKISQAVNGAHDGGIFSICVIKDGGLLTGGKDRRLIEWDVAYQKTGREHEVRNVMSRQQGQH